MSGKFGCLSALQQLALSSSEVLEPWSRTWAPPPPPPRRAPCTMAAQAPMKTSDFRDPILDNDWTLQTDMKVSTPSSLTHFTPRGRHPPARSPHRRCVAAAAAGVPVSVPRQAAQADQRDQQHARRPGVQHQGPCPSRLAGRPRHGACERERERERRQLRRASR